MGRKCVAVMKKVLTGVVFSVGLSIMIPLFIVASILEIGANSIGEMTDYIVRVIEDF